MKVTLIRARTDRNVVILIAATLVVLGLFIGIVTFLTVIGPILGLLLVAIGAFLIWSLRHPTERMEETATHPAHKP